MPVGKIGLGTEGENPFDQGRLGRREARAEFATSPDVVLTFHAFGLGIEGRAEAAPDIGEFPQQKPGRFFRELLVARVAGQLEGFGVDLEQLGVVVQHLLEMGDAPGAVGAVAMKSAAQLVMQTAGRHGIERSQNHCFGFGIA